MRCKLLGVDKYELSFSPSEAIEKSVILHDMSKQELGNLKNIYKQDIPEENLYSEDYSQVDTERREFVIPHAAEGDLIHTISVENKNDGQTIETPASFHIKGNEFYLTGLQKDTENGVLIGGLISGDKAKIKHIEVAKKLKGTGIVSAFVRDLEEQLRRINIKVVLSSFYKEETIEFFLKNNYSVASFSSLDLSEQERSELYIHREEVDLNVNNINDFNLLKAKKDYRFKKVLMEKKLNPKAK